ncbi:MAG: hypothetical protein ACP5R5_12790 [Armatimonadota bacterium]
MPKRIILGVHISSRVEHVPDVQKVLTEYGCHIKTRLGLHDVNNSVCSPNGLLILETCGEEAGIAEMKKKLGAIPGVTVKEMVFEE